MVSQLESIQDYHLSFLGTKNFPKNNVIEPVHQLVYEGASRNSIRAAHVICSKLWDWSTMIEDAAVHEVHYLDVPHLMKLWYYH